MEYKRIEKNGRTLRVYEDGRVYREAYTMVGANGGKRYYKESDSMWANDKGYSYICVYDHKAKKKKNNFYIHRLVAECFLENYSEKLTVDHINGDPTDNRLSNLRMATHAQNIRAFRSKKKNASSQYLGVFLDKRKKEGTRKWHSMIGKDGEYHYLGYYHTEKEAALAYNEKALELGFAKERLNVIEK